MKVRLLSIVLFALCAGCSTTLSVTDISGLTSDEFNKLDQAERGIPFRVTSPYTVRLFQKQVDGSYATVGKPVHVKLPNTDKLYALNYDSGQFSNHTFALTLNPNGTIASVGATETKQIDEAITAIGTEVTDVAGAIVDRDVTELTAEKAKLELEAGVLDARRLLIEAERNLEAAEEFPAEEEDEEDVDEDAQ